MNNKNTGLGPAVQSASLLQTRPLEDCACLQLRMASRAISRLFDKILEPSGLKATQFSFLAAIDESDEPTLGELATHLVMDASTVARNLKPLEKGGLIVIQTARDRRRRIVRLTQKGVLKLAAAIPLWLSAHDVLQDRVGADMLSVNGHNLKQFVECLSDRPRGAELDPLILPDRLAAAGEVEL